MSLGDVLKTPEFVEQLKSMVLSTNMQRQKPHKRHPSDRLVEKGVFNATDLKSLYVLSLAKQLTGYSSLERKYIELICDKALAETVKKLKTKKNEHNREEETSNVAD